MTQTIKIFEVYWNERRLYTGESYDKAKARILSEMSDNEKYGYDEDDPLQTDNKWAEYEGDTGWRINEREVEVQDIQGGLKGGDFTIGELAHVIWACPLCGKYYADDYYKGDKSPFRVSCFCDKDSEVKENAHHFYVHFEVKIPE